MACNTIKNNKTKVCTGDRDQKIIVQTTTTTDNNSPGTYQDIAFQDLATMWAMVKTSPNNRYIDNVNTSGVTTTDFYFPYTADIDYTIKLWVDWRGIKFKVLSTENIAKQFRTIRLRASETGDSTYEANLR